MTTINKNDMIDRQTQFGDDTPVADVTVDTGVEAQAEPQRKDRAKARIKQLASEKNAFKQEAADYKRMYEETLQKMQTETKTSNASLKVTLEQQYQNILQRMGDAIRAGEADAVVQCQDQMVSIKIQLDKMGSQPT